MRWTLAFCLTLLALVTGRAQSGPASEDIYRVYTEPPRIFLRPQRLRLLKRESERKSIRWEQFQTLVGGGARMAEPGFAYALHSAITGNRESTAKAIEWAVNAKTSMRQIALVYDWCRPSLSPAQAKTIEAKLIGAAQAKASSVAGVRDRVLAAVAISDVAPDVSERAIRDVLTVWWPGLASGLESGKVQFARDDLFPLFEILHVIRDSLSIDMREDAGQFFKPLPAYFLLSHYPAALPEVENEYRIPAFKGPGEPDLPKAMLSRAAGLSMVAFDSNAQDSQFLQGWLLQDHFLMRSSFGIPYELLWANPYQPGLPYFRFPLYHHDPLTGGLFMRSSWDDDAEWFGLVSGQMQLFSEGKVTLMDPQLKQRPIEIGPALIVIASEPLRFDAETKEDGRAFVIGLKSKTRYNIEVDDEEMSDSVTDPAGTLSLPLPALLKAGVRITETSKGFTK
jgi:hypothetical protein